MTMAEHDKAEKEFFKERSLSALGVLMEHGRELEFRFDGADCFLSPHETKEAVSLWVNGKEQSFSSLKELSERAEVCGKNLKTVMRKAELLTLF